MIFTKGTRLGDVYSLPMKINAHCSSHFQIVDEVIWYARLGHPSLCLVRHLHNKGAIRVSNKQSLSFICDHCTLAKSSQMPFFIH